MSSDVQAYAITLFWLAPCISNGDIQNYSVTWRNKDNSSDSGISVSLETHIEFTNILPYRNYTFKIAASTKVGSGNYSDDYDLQSKIASKYLSRNLRKCFS